MKVRKRHLAFAWIFIAGCVFAAAPIANFDPVVFEQRFNKADKGRKGKLSRAEAYAEFPRMPEFFDEIDTNKDGFITLAEVRQAMDRRVNAAMNAGKTGTRYGLDAGASGAAKDPASAAKQPKQFPSDAEARRYYQNQYYESLAASKALARERGEPVSKAPENQIFNKSF